MSSDNPHSEKTALSDGDIQRFFTKHNIPYHFFPNFESLTKNEQGHSSGIVHTGVKEDEFNTHEVNGKKISTTNHWLYYNHPYIWDSYGDKNAYNPKLFSEHNLKFWNPHQIQAFGDNVCGEYCCGFAWLTKTNPSGVKIPLEANDEFINRMKFTKNFKDNDKKILEFFKNKNE